ncbi:MAG: Hsp20/alpha crystallin family protein [Candidatus Binatia bacterium]|nr:Hsp20/alpha crystallin family protein [Candidatus Binatia bacterium]
MAQWIPDSWKRALVRLRDDIQQALTRWLPRWGGRGKENTYQVPIRYSSPVEWIRDDLLTVFDRWLSPWRWGDVGDETWPSTLVFGGGPMVDVEETDDAVVVQAELPGLEKEDFTVEVSGNRLILRGEKRYETEERRHGYYYTERSYGAFSRVIPLPCEVETDRATAKYKNGLLRITLPKTARARARRFTVPVRG